MFEKRIEPVKGRTAEIIECIMSSPDVPDEGSVEFAVRLSVEEVAENIVQYAYEDGEGYVVISTERICDRLVITMKDGGVPFNPLEKEDPDLTLSAEERQIGGLGIFLCKQMMDNVEYEYADGCNVLRMEKTIK